MKNKKEIAREYHDKWIMDKLKKLDAIETSPISEEGAIIVIAKEQHDGLKLFIEAQHSVKTLSYGINSQIKSKLLITEVAKKYGLKVKKNKCVCPFHGDKDPSLSLSDEKNVFYCFGCHAKGDVIEFIRRLEEVGKKRSD